MTGKYAASHLTRLNPSGQALSLTRRFMDHMPRSFPKYLPYSSRKILPNYHVTKIVMVGLIDLNSNA